VILTGDADAIEASTVKVPTECAPEIFYGSTLIKCPPGVEAGTAIPIIRATVCEYLYPEDQPGGIDGTVSWFARSRRSLIAVYTETETEPYFQWVPRGTHVVVVWTESTELASRASAFSVRGNSIAGIRFGCTQNPEDYYRDVPSSRFLVGPLPYP
jgi:hypothetical protein